MLAGRVRCAQGPNENQTHSKSSRNSPAAAQAFILFVSDGAFTLHRLLDSALYSVGKVRKTSLVQEILARVLQPVVDAMRRPSVPYQGVLYAGLMLTDQGPRVLEFNCRFGDPETQMLLPLLDSDLLDVMLAWCWSCRLRTWRQLWKPSGKRSSSARRSPGMTTQRRCSSR